MNTPELLLVSISRFHGPSYSVEKSGDTLTYKANDWERGYTEKVYTPSGDEWEAFQAVLDEIGVWKWKACYDNLDIADGTQWKLKMQWDGRKKKCYGSNSYPLKDGKPSGETGSSPAFERLLNAVSALIEGQKFC